MESLTPKRLLALRYVSVALGLIATHMILSTLLAGEKDVRVPDALIAFFYVAWLPLILGMFWPSPGSTGPLWAGIIGCSISLFVHMQERGVSPNWTVVLVVLALLAAHVFVKIIFHSCSNN